MRGRAPGCAASSRHSRREAEERVLIKVAVALLAQAVASGDPVDAPVIGLIHVEANVDAAAGGHVALRVGPHVYHFQQAGGGLLRLTRTEWTGFRHVYPKSGLLDSQARIPLQSQNIRFWVVLE